MCDTEPGNFNGTDTVAAEQRYIDGRGLPPAPLMPAVQQSSLSKFIPPVHIAIASRSYSNNSVKNLDLYIVVCRGE